MSTYKFKDFNITSTTQSFTGDKKRVTSILNKEIVIHDYKLENSKYPDKGEKCLHLQISIGDTKHVVFTGSKYLADMIQRVPKDKFPFTATIVKEDERLVFT